ncbi:hypothetical protein VTI28DRAFT_1261 [Corynascus sepedonium]
MRWLGTVLEPCFLSRGFPAMKRKALHSPPTAAKVSPGALLAPPSLRLWLRPLRRNSVFRIERSATSPRVGFTISSSRLKLARP